MPLISATMVKETIVYSAPDNRESFDVVASAMNEVLGTDFTYDEFINKDDIDSNLDFDGFDPSDFGGWITAAWNHLILLDRIKGSLNDAEKRLMVLLSDLIVESEADEL